MVQGMGCLSSEQDGWRVPEDRGGGRMFPRGLGDRVWRSKSPAEAGGGHARLGLLAKVFILRDGTLLRSSEELLQLQGGAGGRGQGRGGRGGVRQR